MTSAPFSPQTYPSVFITDPFDESFTVWAFLFGVVVMVILGAVYILLAESSRTFKHKLWLAILAPLGVIGAVVFIINGITIVNNHNAYIELVHTQDEHMQAGLKQKYDATPDLPQRELYGSDELTTAHEYKLSFPDGKRGSYLVKWDKTTSEPTIVDQNSPTAQELNQNANKH